MEWQPIETAPQDGTVVDIWDGYSKERLTDYIREDLGGGNIFYEPTKGGRCVVRTATHWMKRPAPPEAG